MKRIEFGEFRLSQSSRNHLEKVLASNWLTMGKKVKEFEDKFRDIFSYPYCRMVSSGTMADTIACMALYEYGAKQGDEIICPALSFIATANSIRLAGFKPVFVDVNYDLNINTDLIEKAVTSRTRAIMAVNLMGKPAKLEVIEKIAEKYNLKLIIDNCEGYGCTRQGLFSLDYGDFETTSHFTAHICMVGGEGGCVFTNKEEDDRLVEAIRSHGRLNGSTHFNHPIFGLNGKPTDVSAAIGLGELEEFTENFAIRRANIKFFYENLKQYKDLVFMTEEDSGDMNAPHGFSVVFKKPGDAAKFKEDMDLANIHIKKNFGSMPTGHDCFKYLGHKWGEFPVAEWCGENGWHWGCHRYLTDDDLVYIVNKVSASLERMY